MKDTEININGKRVAEYDLIPDLPEPDMFDLDFEGGFSTSVQAISVNCRLINTKQVTAAFVRGMNIHVIIIDEDNSGNMFTRDLVFPFIDDCIQTNTSSGDLYVRVRPFGTTNESLAAVGVIDEELTIGSHGPVFKTFHINSIPKPTEKIRVVKVYASKY